MDIFWLPIGAKNIRRFHTIPPPLNAFHFQRYDLENCYIPCSSTTSVAA